MDVQGLSADAPPTFRFDNTYARLPDRFFARVKPTPVRAPRLLRVNRPLAELLGLDPGALETAAGARIFAGNEVPAGADPIALAYAGHQFGSFVRQLGDGRAILLGELVGADGVRRDVQLKGAGPTPFSRGGDGRAAVGPVIREYVVSEAMAALGIPTTRALAAVATGQPVFREDPLPGAVLTRIAKSHLRVGTFEFFAARGDEAALAELAAYALARHYPDVPRGSPADDARALLDQVITAQAELVARWLGVGFIHGVMNTDNTTISGETIDYGPCAFLDEYDPGKKFSAIDQGGRYAFANQPRIAHWNVTRLAEALLPLFTGDEDEVVRAATAILERFPTRFEAARLRVFRGKLGLTDLGDDEGDAALIDDLLTRMASARVDFTIGFRALADAAEPDAAGETGTAAVAKLFMDPAAFLSWAEGWERRLAREAGSADGRARAMRAHNPAFIPRNHQVERAIAAAIEDDLGPFERLVDVLARPYDDQPEHRDLALAPLAEERVLRTFCGT